MKVDVYNIENKIVESIEIPDSLFGERWRPALVAQVVTAHRANSRRPWAHAKGRGEVRGGGKKPWRQKGTGRARHGSIRSPLWVGGGKSHGPNKERDYTQKINKKMNRTAIFSILAKKFHSGEVKIVDGLAPKESKTKMLASALRTLTSVSSKVKRFDALLIPAVEEKNTFRAAQNLPKVKAIHPSSLNVYDILNHKRVFIAKEAVPFLTRHYHLS
ncbi:MAG: 50S ribosomal protein L4 [Candidatus Liptonbacteria bacterium]|nr:50S ribosomal protein L4 [Candidatus Liptonbacteria bacterium]